MKDGHDEIYLAMITLCIREPVLHLGRYQEIMVNLGYTYADYMPVLDKFVKDGIVRMDWRTYHIHFNG